MYITGWTALLALCAAVPAFLLQDRLVAWWWVLGVVAFACLDAALAAPTRSVSVRRFVPGAVRLTESTTSTVELVNETSRTTRGAIRDAWPPSAGAASNRHRFSLAAGERGAFVTPLRPVRRGERRAAAVTIRTEGPLRLGGRQRSLPTPTTLRVLPEFASRKHLPARLARLRELDGLSPIMMRGAGTEFDSLREYVIGDDVRSIDWRATARRSEVVVRTWRPERDRRVLILLDTSRTSALRVGDAPRIDASIEAALLLSALASHAGDRVELVAFDRRTRARVAGMQGSRLMPALADALATVSPELTEIDWTGAVGVIQERLSQRALVVLLTAIEASAAETGLLEAVARLDHQVVVASVRDPEVAVLARGRDSAHEVFDAAAAERAELERAAVTMRLRQRGAEVVDALPDELAPQLADAYLALKAAGRL